MSTKTASRLRQSKPTNRGDDNLIQADDLPSEDAALVSETRPMTTRSSLKRLVTSALSRADLAILPINRRNSLEQTAAIGSKALALGMVDDGGLRRALELLAESQSQLNQDFFVLSELDWKRDGFFVEFGAADGHVNSNSWLLEKHFGWSGILSEPARTWRKALSGGTRTAKIDFDCVWSKTGEELTFNEADWAELSTVNEFFASDIHKRDRTKSYQVNTVSLNDLLIRHNAPNIIDYLSIDTEGSEYKILKELDFSSWKFRCISCEHNNQPIRDDIFQLLSANGYKRKFEAISRFDDWYVFEG
jgi:FkbM family methyltransferase